MMKNDEYAVSLYRMIRHAMPITPQTPFNSLHKTFTSTCVQVLSSNSLYSQDENVPKEP